MIICPWCGTNYLVFQPNCKNCGGPLPAVDEKSISSTSAEKILEPPPAPRPILNRYVWHLLSSDGWWIAGLIFGILGAIFSLVGAVLILGIITAFVGLPFLLIGLAFLGAGGFVFAWRYQEARKIVDVLREGETSLGKIIEVQENYSVTVNGRHPWLIRYQFRANGQDYEGRVNTLNPPGGQLQTGKSTYVLYLPSSPNWSSIYPHP
jgi:hypothetical protein